MDCPYCGGKIEIEEWAIWSGVGICKECGKTYSIELKEIDQ